MSAHHAEEDDGQRCDDDERQQSGAEEMEAAATMGGGARAGGGGRAGTGDAGRSVGPMARKLGGHVSGTATAPGHDATPADGRGNA